jgi:DNA polymerase-3 subunit alpha
MPDIDIDFPTDKRNMVIDYVKEKYGKNKVCNISAFDTFQVKSSIQDLGRVLGLDKTRLSVLSKVAGQAQNYEELLSRFSTNDDIKDLLIIAKKMENLPRHLSTHAAGIVLSYDDLSNVIPYKIVLIIYTKHNGIKRMLNL